MRNQAPPVPAPASDGGITIHNRLPPGHRCAAAMDEVFRIALRDLPGPWDVSVYSAGQAWFRVDVVAPDGASWSTSVPVHGGPRREELADTVRTACLRHPRRKPTNSKRRAGKPVDGCSAGDRGGGPKSGLSRGRAATSPSPATKGRNVQVKIEATAKEIRALLELAELDQSADQPTSAARRQAWEAAVHRVPQRVFERYQRLIEGGRAPAVVAIVQGACSGCHLRLPTMIESIARRSPAFHTCPHCRRMLYVPELLREDSPAGGGTLSRRATEASAARRS